MYEKFEKLLEERNTTIYRVAKDTGVHASTLYDWKYGSYTPKADKLYAIAKYFGVPMEYFMED